MISVIVLMKAAGPIAKGLRFVEGHASWFCLCLFVLYFWASFCVVTAFVLDYFRINRAG